jgi:hypothetical protein
MFMTNPQKLLTITQADAETAPGIAPVDSTFKAGYTTGTAFYTAMPGKSDLAIFQGIILNWTDIQARLVSAILAGLGIDPDMGDFIHAESGLSQLILYYHSSARQALITSLTTCNSEILPLISSLTKASHLFRG